MKIPYVNLRKQYSKERKLLSEIDKSLSSGNWIGGDEVDNFEKKFLKFVIQNIACL